MKRLASNRIRDGVPPCTSYADGDPGKCAAQARLTLLICATTLFDDETFAIFRKSVAAPVGDPFTTGAASGTELVARLPKIWIGYLLAVATLIGEMIAVAHHPEVVKSVQFAVPPLELFLPAFLAAVYWLVCIHRYHVVLAHVPGWKHPITPARAVWFHLIPIFNVYWVFRWPYVLATFVNGRMGAYAMSLWAPGTSFLLSLVCRIFDPALGTAMLFFTCAYVSRHLKRALEVPISLES
jgi:hypothetical protein